MKENKFYIWAIRRAFCLGFKYALPDQIKKLYSEPDRDDRDILSYDEISIELKKADLL